MVDDWYAFPTNYSNGTSVDGPGQLFLSYPGFILNDWMGLGIVSIIWLFTFIISMSSGSKKALLTSSFIAFIFSVWFIRLGMINPLVCLVLIIFTIIGALGEE